MPGECCQGVGWGGSEQWQSSKEPLAADRWGKCLVTTKTGMKIKIKWEVLRAAPPLLTDLGSLYAAVLRVTKTFCHGVIQRSRWRNHTCQIIGHGCIFFVFVQIRLRLALSGSFTHPPVFTPVASLASTCLIVFSIPGFPFQVRRGGGLNPDLGSFDRVLPAVFVWGRRLQSKFFWFSKKCFTCLSLSKQGPSWSMNNSAGCCCYLIWPHWWHNSIYSPGHALMWHYDSWDKLAWQSMTIDLNAGLQEGTMHHSTKVLQSLDVFKKTTKKNTNSKKFGNSFSCIF